LKGDCKCGLKIGILNGDIKWRFSRGY